MKPSLIIPDEDLLRSIYVIAARAVDIYSSTGNLGITIYRLSKEYDVTTDKVFDAVTLAWMLDHIQGRTMTEKRQ